MLFGWNNSICYIVGSSIALICIICGVFSKRKKQQLCKEISVLLIPIAFYILLEVVIDEFFGKYSEDVAENQGSGWAYIVLLVAGIVIFTIVYGLTTFKATRFLLLPALVNGVSVLYAYPIWIVAAIVFVITLIAAVIATAIYNWWEDRYGYE